VPIRINQVARRATLLLNVRDSWSTKKAHKGFKPWRSLKKFLLDSICTSTFTIIILFESGNVAHKRTDKKHTNSQRDSVGKNTQYGQ